MKLTSNALTIGLILVLLVTFTFDPGFKRYASAATTDELDFLEELFSDEDFIEFITIEEDEMVYNLELEDGSVHQYVENTEESNGVTTISTKIFDITTEPTTLIDEFITEIYEENDNLMVESEGEEVVSIDIELLQSNASLEPKIDLYQPKVISNTNQMTTTSTTCTKWTKTRFPGMNLGYCTITSKIMGGNATYSTMKKTGVRRNSDYENFIVNVNSLRSKESAIVGSVSLVEVGKALIKLGKGQWSMSAIGTILKKAFLPLTLAYTMFMWVWQYDKTLNNYYRLTTK